MSQALKQTDVYMSGIYQRPKSKVLSSQALRVEKAAVDFSIYASQWP